MTKTRVAFVLSGGVSAGAYIAGALDELLRAFRATDEFEIDIITGASAGATTAALIAHGLCYRDGDSGLFHVWVDNVDMVDFLAPDRGQNDPVSVLSAAHLRQITQDVITWAPENGPPTRAKFCAPDLTVAMTLGNFTSLEYITRVHRIAPLENEVFVQERNAEQETFKLGSDIGPSHPIWERIGSVALASSAVPLVFPMVELSRSADDPAHYLVRPNFEGTRQFWYYDGGTYNNLPVDLAWHYLRSHAQDEQADPFSNRRVVIVNPWRSYPQEINRSSSYPGLLSQLVNLVKDFRIESNIVRFTNDDVRFSSEQRPTDALMRNMQAIPGVDPPPVQLLPTFAMVIPHLNAPPLRCLYLAYTSAFLDRKFREYDFRRGAADARHVAKTVFGITAYDERPDEFYTPDLDEDLRVDIRDYEALATIPSAREPDRSVRAVFEDALERRLRTLIDHLGPSGPGTALTDAVVTWIVKSAILERLPRVWDNEI